MKASLINAAVAVAAVAAYANTLLAGFTFDDNFAVVGAGWAGAPPARGSDPVGAAPRAAARAVQHGAAQAPRH
jgi:hypothetical protein